MFRKKKYFKPKVKSPTDYDFQFRVVMDVAGGEEVYTDWIRVRVPAATKEEAITKWYKWAKSKCRVVMVDGSVDSDRPIEETQTAWKEKYTRSDFEKIEKRLSDIDSTIEGFFKTIGRKMRNIFS